MVQLAGNRFPEARLAICQRKPTTGGTGVSEFTEISDGTQEIRKFPAGTGYLRHKCQTQGRKDEFPEVGVSHSSGEAGNDRGAKGWQTDRAQERNNDRTQQRRTIMVNET